MSSFSPTTFGFRWAKLATSSLGTAFHSDHSNGSRPKGPGSRLAHLLERPLLPAGPTQRMTTCPRAMTRGDTRSTYYVASGLNARIGSDEPGEIRAVALEAFEAVAQVPATITFWALPRADLLDPPERSDSWFVHRAWWLMSGRRRSNWRGRIWIDCLARTWQRSSRRIRYPERRGSTA